MTSEAQKDRHHDAIVIGGGIGGLAFSAVAGAVLGKKILMLEKNADVGGRLYSFHKDGFTLDIGAHVISQSEKGPLGDVLGAVGKEGEIKWKHVRPMTSHKGEIFAFPRGLEGRIAPDQYDKLMSLMREMLQMEDTATHELDDIDLKSYVTGKGVTDPLALSCINNITMVYICVPHYQSSTGEFIRCLSNEARSRASGYPTGGCSAISKALADGIKENAGEIRTKSEAEEIIIENNRAVGVRCGDAIHHAPVIVSNADGRRTLLDLLPKGTLKSTEHTRVEAMTYSYSMLIVRMALKHPITDLRLVTHIANFDPKKYEEELLSGNFPAEVNLFMPVPSNFSPECAPEGKQLISAGAFVPYGAPGMDRLEELVVETADGIFPGLKEAIMWRHVTTPENLHRIVGENGAIIGLGQNVSQVGKNRLGVETSVGGLYLCGAESGGSGVGIELAIN
ncbi:MAG: NAD(P)/FAD-dependent oxidoreductase, partial [Deltaproteobacteria bacterium]|nr:NAD(P)/FAD-dependent oxidoreductase [Deltaproteobacteria bacterium]